MNIQFESKTSDYPEGAIKICVSSPNEAFRLGEMFNGLWGAGYEAVCATDKDVWIRIPLTKRESRS